MQLEKFPFSHAGLLGGLRSYLDAPGLQMVDISQLPPPEVLPGTYGSLPREGTDQPFLVRVRIQGEEHDLALMLHEANSDVLARQIRFFTHLADELPILVPGYVSGVDDENWLVLELLEDLLPPTQWSVDDYREAVDNLAILHDRFWGLGEDLEVFGCLMHPLDDLDLHSKLKAAAQTLYEAPPHQLLNTERCQAVFYVFGQHLEHIANPLRMQIYTLLHGNYWAGTIARPRQGRQIVTSWESASLGPAILDVVMFWQNTTIHLQPPISPMGAVARYRTKLEELRRTPTWDDSEWEKLWAHGLMWQFAIHWLRRLVELPAEELETVVNTIYLHWMEPIAQAMQDHLAVRLPD